MIIPPKTNLQARFLKPYHLGLVRMLSVIWTTRLTTPAVISRSVREDRSIEVSHKTPDCLGVVSEYVIGEP